MFQYRYIADPGILMITRSYWEQNGDSFLMTSLGHAKLMFGSL